MKIPSEEIKNSQPKTEDEFIERYPLISLEEFIEHNKDKHTFGINMSEWNKLLKIQDALWNMERNISRYVVDKLNGDLEVSD